MPTLRSAETAVYRVDTGDRLQIAVQDLDVANGEYVIDDSGHVSLPMIEPVPVRGLSFREVENTLEQALLAGGILNSPAVNVQPVSLRPFYVLGEVNSPGEFDYRQGITVLSALAAAGGYTYRAKSGKVAITRTMDGKQVTFQADENAAVLPGDRIRVFERWF
jgi:polysaccharide export outer membrane protein